MAYVEFHDEMNEHPKTRRLARRLAIERPMACWYVLRAHHWAMRYATDGDLSECDREDIAEFVGWPGEPDDLFDAMREAGFVDPDGCLHNWQKFGGKYVRAREQGNARQAKYRAKFDQMIHGEEPQKGDASRDDHFTVSDRGDKRREAQRIEAKRKGEEEELETRPDDGPLSGSAVAKNGADPEKITAHGPPHHGLTALPENWSLDPQLRDETKAKQGWTDATVDHVAAKFRQWHIAKGTMSQSWSAEWWVWVEREVVDERKAKQSRKTPSEKPATPMDPEWWPNENVWYCASYDGWSDDLYRREVKAFRQRQISVGATSRNWDGACLDWLREQPNAEPANVEPVAASAGDVW